MRKSSCSLVLFISVFIHLLSASAFAMTDEQLFETMRHKDVSYFKCSYNSGKEMGVKQIGQGPMFKLEWLDGVSQIYSYMVSGRRTYNYDVRDSLGGKWVIKGGNKPKEPYILRNIDNDNTIRCRSF